MWICIFTNFFFSSPALQQVKAYNSGSYGIAPDRTCRDIPGRGQISAIEYMIKSTNQEFEG